MSERDNRDLTPEERQLQQSVRDLGEVRANDAFRAKLRQRFVSGEFAAAAETPAAESPKIVELPPQKRTRRRFLAVLPAIAAVLAIVIFSGGDPEWKMEDVRGQGTVTVNYKTAEATDPDAVAKLIVPNARISVPEGVQLDVVLGGVMVIGVAGPADFTMPDSPDGDDYAYAATVHRGEFRIKTGPDFPGSKVRILTTEGRIEITGTTIAVYKNDEVTCVCVLEGTALIGKDGDHMDAISAGMRKVMFVDGRDPAIIPIEPGHKAGLIEFEGYNEDTFEPTD